MAKIKLSEKIGYALGDAAAGGITWKIMSIAFPLFFTNVFGLTFYDAAVLMLVARLIDVFIDPVIGVIADRTQSRWGTYRPWVIFGSIPLGVIFALLLYTPDLGPVGKRVYAYFFYILMMLVYSLVNVPFGSLLGVMTDDDNEKNQFSAFRMVGAYAMGFVTLLSFPYLQKFVGGTDQHQYAVLGCFFGALAAAGTLACGLLTKERLKPVRAEKFSGKQFVDLVKNKPWIFMTLTAVCTNFFNGFRYAVAGYMFSYCMGGDITGDLHDLRRSVAGLHQMAGLEAQNVYLLSFHLFCDLHSFLLHPDETSLYLGDDRRDHPHFGRCRHLLPTAVVNVCRRGRIRNEEERYLLHRSYLLLRHDGTEVWHSYLWFADRYVPWFGRRAHDHRPVWQPHHRPAVHHRLRADDGLGPVLSVPGSLCIDHDAAVLSLSH